MAKTENLRSVGKKVGAMPLLGYKNDSQNKKEKEFPDVTANQSYIQLMVSMPWVQYFPVRYVVAALSF